MPRFFHFVLLIGFSPCYTHNCPLTAEILQIKMFYRLLNTAFQKTKKANKCFEKLEKNAVIIKCLFKMCRYQHFFGFFLATVPTLQKNTVVKKILLKKIS